MALIVNGERIEDSQIEQEIERLRPEYERVFADQSPEEREAQLLDWSRENVLERVLVNQEALQAGEEIPQEQIESVLNNLKEQYADLEQLYEDFQTRDEQKIKEQIELQIRVERRLAEVTRDLPEPSNEQIRSYYEQNKADYMYPEQVRVAHIVKYVNWQVDEQAALDAIQQARAELKAGAPFEAVVDKHTDCADSGGDLGYVARGQMVEEFEDVIFKLGAGQVSDVFRTRFGFHIAKVYDKRPAEPAKLEEVKDQIVETLKEQIREEAVNEFIDGLKEKAKIEQV